MRPHWPMTARRLIVIRLDTFDLLVTHPLPIKTVNTVPPHARIRTARFVWGAKFVQHVSIRTIAGLPVPTRPTVSAQFNLQEVGVGISCGHTLRHKKQSTLTDGYRPSLAPKQRLVSKSAAFIVFLILLDLSRLRLSGFLILFLFVNLVRFAYCCS